MKKTKLKTILTLIALFFVQASAFANDQDFNSQAFDSYREYYLLQKYSHLITKTKTGGFVLNNEENPKRITDNSHHFYKYYEDQNHLVFANYADESTFYEIFDARTGNLLISRESDWSIAPANIRFDETKDWITPPANKKFDETKAAKLESEIQASYSEIDKLFPDQKSALKAVTEFGDAIHFIPAKFRDDEVVKAALSWNGRHIEYASPKLRDNKDVAREAVSDECWNIAHVSDRLKDDYEIAKIAISQNLGSYYLLSERLQKDPNLLQLVLKRCSNLGHHDFSDYGEHRVYEDILGENDDLIRNNEMLMKYLKKLSISTDCKAVEILHTFQT